MSITINGSGDINATGNDIELNSTGTTDVTLALGGGSVGVGVASPDRILHLNNSGTEQNVRAKFTNGTTGVGASNGFEIGINASNPAEAVLVNYENSPMSFFTNGSERARIDSSGNFTVGNTSAIDVSTGSATGFTSYPDGRTDISRDGYQALNLRRLTSDGVIQYFYIGTGAVGNIGGVSGNLYIATNGGSNQCGVFFVGGSDPRVIPCNATGSAVDNGVDLGYSNARWDDIWATNGTIQTSDANEKQDVAELDEAEKRVATAAKGLIRKFRWISSVEEKGDDARIHVGVIAQDLKAAFEAEGLDPGRYAMFTSNTWWEADEVVPAVEEVIDEEGNVITEAQPEYTRTNTYQTAEEAPAGAVERTRLGVRYNQLLAFIIGAL